MRVCSTLLARNATPDQHRFVHSLVILFAEYHTVEVHQPKSETINRGLNYHFRLKKVAGKGEFQESRQNG